MSALSQFTGGKLPFGIKSTAFYVDALVVGAGGGPAGNTKSSSGGGRVLQAFNLLAEKNNLYDIIVGQSPAFALNGEDSSFGQLVAQGGGARGQIGGSGGGGVGSSGSKTVFASITTYTANELLNVSNIISSGNDGGGDAIPGFTNGGGGGAGTPGGTPPASTIGGNGGNALISIIKGPGPYYYGAGKGGAGISSPGADGFGAGGNGTGTGGTNGVVIIAQLANINGVPVPLATTTGTVNVFTGATATRVGYHVYEFLSSGTITFN